jgi:hypothetical protein
MLGPTIKILYGVFLEESAILRKNVLQVKLYRYNQAYLHPNLKGYGDNGKISFKE